MVSLTEIFSELYNGVDCGAPRFKLIASNVVLDTLTKWQYYLHYDKPFEIVKGDEIILSGNDMTKDEAEILYQVQSKLPSLRRQRVYNLHREVVPDEVKPLAHPNGGYNAK